MSRFGLVQPIAQTECSQRCLELWTAGHMSAFCENIFECDEMYKKAECGTHPDQHVMAISAKWVRARAPNQCFLTRVWFFTPTSMSWLSLPNGSARAPQINDLQELDRLHTVTWHSRAVLSSLNSAFCGSSRTSLVSCNRLHSRLKQHQQKKHCITKCDI